MNSRVFTGSPSHRYSFRRIILLIGMLVVLLVSAASGYIWWRSESAAPGEAPEAEAVLAAQVQLPFQVLIPAYLPKAFIRQATQVNIVGSGPNSEAMVEIIYQTRRGESLTIYEWLPSEQEAGGRKAVYCMCVCKTAEDCTSVDMSMTFGSLRVRAKVSAPDIMTSEEGRAVLDTLGPAANQQVITSLEQVPASYSVPPAVEIPINADGIQEVTLVITPNGYDPEHFSVKKDNPVRLIFRQLGQVGCGNELIFQWGKGKSATIYLATTGDSQVLEFTPREMGDFRFNCPHLIYRGVMTVLEQ